VNLGRSVVKCSTKLLGQWFPPGYNCMDVDDVAPMNRENCDDAVHRSWPHWKNIWVWRETKLRD